MEVEDLLSILFEHRSDVVYVENSKSNKANDPWSFYIKRFTPFTENKDKKTKKYEQNSRLIDFAMDKDTLLRTMYSGIVKRLNDVINHGQYKPRFIKENQDIQHCLYILGTVCNQYEFTQLIQKIVMEQHSLKWKKKVCEKLNYHSNLIHLQKYYLHLHICQILTVLLTGFEYKSESVFSMVVRHNAGHTLCHLTKIWLHLKPQL